MLPRLRDRARLALLLGIAAQLLMLGASMAQQCPLSAPLILSDLQSGVVGQTGTVWTVAPDCSFTVARQTGMQVAAPHKHGRLNADQRRRLTALLRAVAPATLPAQVGAPRANPRQIVISYGDAGSIVTLAAPGSAQGGAADDQRAARVQELAELLREITGG